MHLRVIGVEPLFSVLIKIVAVLESLFAGIVFILDAKTTPSERGRSLAWSRTSACHADDPGSNLGDRTIHLLKSALSYMGKCFGKAVSHWGSTPRIRQTPQSLDSYPRPPER